MSYIIKAMFDGFRETTPMAFSVGGPREEQLVLSHSLPLPEVDGQGINEVDALEEAITPKIELIVGDRSLHIASALVVKEEDAPNDEYLYTLFIDVLIR